MDCARLARRVTDLLETDVSAFESRVAEEATRIKSAVAEGSFDDTRSRLGIEYEWYAVDESGVLTDVAPAVFDLPGFERELCRHQAELSTQPQPLSRYGIEAQEAELRARIDAALGDQEGWLVSDGLWTIPPGDTSARAYLTGAASVGDVTLARSVSPVARYHAQGNCGYSSLRLRAPGVRGLDGSVALNGLCTSIQPHYQVEEAAALPDYFRYALRVAGPLLALGANSPLFPPDLYEPGVDAATVLEEGWQESRIRVFESVMNPDGEREAVRFPRDVDSVATAIDRIADSETVVPRLFDDGRFSHFQHAHASYWRWVRPVFDAGGTPNVRIEFRPLAAQPTVRDSVAFLAAFAGLLEGLHDADHPVRRLPWETARENFYAAARDGLDADLAWMTADGRETRRREELFDDLFEHAAHGLEARGFPQSAIDSYLGPLRARVERRLTPARWKQERVERRLERGESPGAAIEAVQRTYLRRQRETLFEGDFTEWWPGERTDTRGLDEDRTVREPPAPLP